MSLEGSPVLNKVILVVLRLCMHPQTAEDYVLSLLTDGLAHHCEWFYLRSLWRQLKFKIILFGSNEKYEVDYVPV